MNSLPFKDGLLDGPNLEPKAYTHPDAPGLILRQFEQGIPGLTIVESVALTKGLLDELPKFGVGVVDNHPLVINDEHNFIIAVERISGKSLLPYRFGKNAISVTPYERQALMGLMDSLGAYLASKIDRGEPYLSDVFSLHQYMFDERDRRVKLVDVAPFTSVPRSPDMLVFRADWELGGLLEILRNVGMLTPTVAEQRHFRHMYDELAQQIIQKNNVLLPDLDLVELVPDLLNGVYAADEQGVAAYWSYISDLEGAVRPSPEVE